MSDELFSLLCSLFRLLNLTSLVLYLFGDNRRVVFEGVIGKGGIVDGSVSTMSCNNILSFIESEVKSISEEGCGCFDGVQSGRLLE